MLLFNASYIKKRVIPLFIIGVVILFSGCAEKNKYEWKLRNTSLTNVDRALKADMPSCDHLSDLKVYTSFSTDLENYIFLEDHLYAYRYNPISDKNFGYYTQKVDTPYSGDMATHFKTMVDNILASRCRITIVENPDLADIVITGEVKKLHSQVIDMTDAEEKGYYDREGTFNMKISTILYVDSVLNNREWTYEELLSIYLEKKEKKDATNYLLAATRDEQRVIDIKTYLNDEFLLSQYSYVREFSGTALLIIPIESSSEKNIFRIYNDDDGQLLRKFKNFDPEKSSSADKREFYHYKGLYTSGYGNLLYLINDYTKQVIERISDEKL